MDRLARLPVDQQFAAIADALGTVEDTTSRTTLAYQIFGRQGTALVNTLALGSAGLADAAAEADALGLSFSRVDAAKIEAANDASTRAAAAVRGITTSLAIELAPVVEASATRFAEWAASGEGMGQRVVNAIDTVADAVGYVADLIELPTAAFRQVQAVVLGVLANILEGLQRLDAAASAALDWIPGIEVRASAMLEDLSDTMRDASSEAQRAAGDAFSAWERGANTRAIRSALAGVRADAAATAEQVAAAAPSGGGASPAAAIEADSVSQVADSLARFDAQLQAVGASPIEIQLRGLEAAGATVDQLDRARTTLEQIDSLERDAEQRNTITQTLDQIDARVADFGRTESERTVAALRAAGATADEIERATDALAQLDSLRAAEAAAQAAERDGQQDTGPAADNTAIAAGSADAQLAAFRAAAEASRPGDEQTPRDTLAEARSQTAILDRMDRRGQAAVRGSGTSGAGTTTVTVFGI